MQGWHNFEQHVAEQGQEVDMVEAYHTRLTSADTAVRDAAVHYHCLLSQLWFCCDGSLLTSINNAPDFAVVDAPPA